MRLRHLPLMLDIALLTFLPGLAKADNLGVTRIAPRLAQALDVADPGGIDDPMKEPGPRPGPAQPISKTLGSGAKDASSRRIESTADGLSAPGGLLDPGAGATEQDDKIGQGQPVGETPELHVVQKGDTLWSLCSKYFGDPWRWPRLWAANPVITNPHWIFPGDVIRLGEGTGGAEAAGMPAASAPNKSPTQSSSNVGGGLGGSGVLLRELGFIEAKDLDDAASISGSREEKIMLSTSDQAYLTYPKQMPLQGGQRYSVFTTDIDHPVVDEATGKRYGYMVHILSDIVVNQIAENDVARGTLVDTVTPVERGARVSAAVRQFKRIEPKPSEVNLEARVVATFEPNTLLGAGHLVVLNRGKRDGVKVGNRAFVIRRGDGYRATLESWEVHDPNSPKEVVGEAWVLDVRDETSVAWIVRSTKELKVGELTEMRKGH